ncbi:MAG: DNA polymerase III subunit [Elusimicrobia bacterium]|nr:DNA polymerase III subunit [Elusimicrobiota bacterium]
MMRVVGHEKQLDMFRTAIKNGRVHSSYMFVGQSGIGKKLFALQLARMLNCQSSDILKRPCGECLSCQKIESGTHPDVMTISVLEEKSWISIDQVKEIIKGLQFSAVQGGYNVRIIDDAHLIQEQAANSLLKILEEPPQNTVIILITPVPRSLPRTISSRCVTVHFGIFSDAEIKSELQKFNLDKSELDFVISIAMGSLGKAIKLASDKESIAEYKDLIDNFKIGKFINKRYERNEVVELLNMLASQTRFSQPEKLEIILKMRNYIRRNTNINLTLEVLRQNLL